MRILAKIEVFGDSIDSIMSAARAEWRRLSANEHAELPEGSEINIQAKTDGVATDYDTYVGTLFIRVSK